MKFLTLEYIKKHSRIDSSAEDELLELYGESAETMVLNDTNMTYDEVVEEYGAVPKPLYHAALMLVETSYMNRDVITPQNMSAVPYTYDYLIKPYIHYSKSE